MEKLCLYFNIPSHYREDIYKRINDAYDCEWYFERDNNEIKTFDVSLLNKYTFLNVLGGRYLYWVKGLIGLLRKDCKYYLMIGATRNLSLFVFLLIKHLLYREKVVVLWTHGYYGKEKWGEKTFFKRPLLKMADCIFLYGNCARELMIKDGFNPDQLHVIHNSLSYEKQLAMRETLQQRVVSHVYQDHFRNDYPNLFFVGRLTKVKKLDMAIRALAMCKENGNNYNLTLIGDGVEKDKLLALTEELELTDRVWFYGACYDEDELGKMIFNADLCVSPGNVGLTAMHSMVFGTPVITHNDIRYQMPEFEAIIDGVTGSFFERDNQESLYMSISNWFSQKNYDRDKIRKACYAEIDTRWNPNFQMKVIRSIIK